VPARRGRDIRAQHCLIQSLRARCGHPGSTGIVLGGSMVVVLDPKQARSVFSRRAPSVLELRLAMLFKAPREAGRLGREEFAEMLDDGETREEDVERILGQLTADGVLVPVAETAPQGRQARYASDAASIATLLHSIAGDLAALGDWAEDRVRIEGASPGERLSALRSEAILLRDAVAAARGEFMAQQMARAPQARGLKIHLGCGGHAVADWVNIDLLSGDMRMNLAWQLPFDDGSASLVYSAHLFEHLNFHTEAPRLAREVHRILEDGGVFRLAVPDMQAYLREYANGNDEFFASCDRQRPEFGSAAGYSTPMSKIMFMAGSAGRPGHFFDHKMGYDFQTLADVLQRAGFSRVERVSYGNSGQPAFAAVDASSQAAGLRFDGVGHALLVEATR
jgi:hypothetical protein